MAEGDRIPLAQTEANVQPDQILASLDGDTRNYLKLLLQGGGEGLGGHGEELSAGFRRFEPLGRYLAKINGGLAERRRNIKRAVSSFGELAAELAESDTRLADFVSTQSQVFDAFANQEANLREMLQELPSTLEETRAALASGQLLSEELGPASEALIPAVQAFEGGQESAQRLARETLAPIRDQIRPFTREVRPTLRHLGQAAPPLGSTVDSTTKTFEDLNRLFNAWAYNPGGPAGGIPLLDRMAQPQREQHGALAGRARGAASRHRPAVVPDRDARRRARRRCARSSGPFSASPAPPSPRDICPITP